MKHRRPALVPLPPPREDDAPYLAFAWFREEEYADFKALLPERDWHDTFAEWDKDIERHVWLARVGGVGVVRATVGGAILWNGAWQTICPSSHLRCRNSHQRMAHCRTDEHVRKRSLRVNHMQEGVNSQLPFETVIPA